MGAAPPELKAEKLREMIHVGQKGGRFQRRRAGGPPGRRYVQRGLSDGD